MIALRRAKDRHHEQSRKREAWRTFQLDDGTDAFARGFGTLELFDEHLLPPGGGIPRQRQRAAEIISYVREGALAHEDSSGRSGVLCAGEFQRRTTGHGLRHSETNASRTDKAHVFQIWLRPPEVGLEPGQEQKRFSVADRRGGPCVVASADARKGSLRIRGDALVCSAMLDAGQHVVHELFDGRSAWLHVVRGEITLGDVVLGTGDGAGITGERAVSLTAREDSEILMVDLGSQLPSPVLT